MKRKIISHSILIAFLGLGLTYCDSADFGSNGVSGSKSKKGDKKGDDDQDDTDDKGSGPGEDPTDGPNPTDKVDDDTDDGNAGEIFDDGDGNRREIFAYGKDAKAPVVDYLFVIDNSPSMGDNVAQLQAGFASLTGDSFPKKSRIAIMNTMPAKPGDLSQNYNGDAQQKLAAANAEPGFLGLVDKARIAAYLAAGGNAKAYTKPGCEKAWFAPDDKDSSGARCFESHTPISTKGGPCEAGLVSFSQFVEKSGKTRIFRKGGLANVVFVSDTHDPGCGGKGKSDLDAARPSFDALKKKVEENSSGLASFKAHAIAPAGACQGSEGNPVSGTTYYAAAEAAKGQKLDLCVSKDFKGVLEKIVADTTAERAVFNLSKDVKDVTSVKVDGEKVEDFKVIDGDTIEIQGLDPEKSVKIEITYSY